MKKISVYILTTIYIAVIGILVACYENIIDDTKVANNGLYTVKGEINLPPEYRAMYDDCNVLSIANSAFIENGKFEIGTCINDKVQTFFVEDYNGVYLISRTPISYGHDIDVSVESTAIGMVTLYPLFSPIESKDYATLTSLITSCSKYQAFYDEVAKSIYSKRHIFDETNEDLLIAFNNLMEELCGEEDEEGDSEYEGSLDDIENASSRRTVTRGIFQHSQINPTYIDAEINGNTLTMRTVWVTPSYYGTVTQPNGQIINKVIPSRSDFGVIDLINNRTTRGEPMEYSFNSEGSYVFNFSRMNEMATLDFYMRIAGSILTTLGLEIEGNEEVIVESAKYISNAIAAAGSGVSDGEMSAMDWFGIAYEAAINQISTKGKLWPFNTIPENIVNVCKILTNSYNWYNKIKGAANLALRLAYAFDAPETINFCLCYYENEITTCTEASLYKVDGDQQTGYANQKLLLPLTVYVQTLGDDGMYHESSSYHRVKFEVVSGGGEVEYELVSADNKNQASTYWFLGEEGEQKVKATVVDIITNKEISDPVYFTAELNRAEITIRLDWTKHSGNTDIDLHVFDPNNEEIYWKHMNSASGGYLDRDDTVGPGPEHVRWTNAPAGTYKIYVHYYPNQAEDRSVTTYWVTVTADGKRYKRATGSIAYDQLIPVGKFTIGESDTTRSISTTLENTAPLNNRTYPEKTASNQVAQ